MYTFKKLDRPVAGSGAPTTGSRFAYLARLKDVVSFPDTDANGVRLVGLPVFKPGSGLVPVYLTSSTREFSYETQGDQDARSFKVKFVASHPGNELEALEFAQNMLDEEFAVFIPGCKSTDAVKVLGRPCAPLIFKSSHKSGKDGSKFEFTFEQEVGGKNTYMLYFGPLNTLETVYGDIDFATPATTFANVQNVKATGTASTLSITNLDALTETQVTFVGNELDPAKAGIIKQKETTPILILLKDGLSWTAVKGSSITFEVIKSGGITVLRELWRV